MERFDCHSDNKEKGLTGFLSKFINLISFRCSKEIESKKITFKEGLEVARSNSYASTQANNRAADFVLNSGFVDQISDYLEDHQGFFEFEYLGAGHNAVILKCNDYLALRIR